MSEVLFMLALPVFLGRFGDWTRIWPWPAAFAALVLVLFAVTFRNETLRGTPA